MITLFLLLFISPAVRGFGICATFDRIIALKPHKNFETAMPFLWKYCKKAKTPTDWCYENKLCGQYTWAKQHPTCAGSKQSPINLPMVSVYSSSGVVTSPSYPSTYFSQPAGCSKSNFHVAEGFTMAMKLKFKTQCCADYTTWKDDLITVSDGNHTVLFNQTAGFSLNTEGEVLFNSVSHSASLEFCKYLSVNQEPGYNLSYQAVLEPLSLAKYDQIVYGDLENTGSVAKLHLTGGSLSGGPLDQTYDIKHISFHWGTHNTRGSEHLLNGKSFPLEMQIVHMTTQNDTAVAGFFFEIDKADNDDLQPLLDLFPIIKMSKAKVQMKNFALTKLLAGVAPLGAAPTTAYTSYTGSLTTPPCTEGVKWINFLTPLKISVSQMETFRTLLKADGTAIKYNYRGVQLLNSRPVTKIDDSVPAPHNLDYTNSTNCVKKVVTGDYFDARFGVENVFVRNETNGSQPEGTYWLGPSNSQGFFIVDFGCQKQRSILEVANVNNGDRATKKFRVFSSSSHTGPWTKLVDDEMVKGGSVQTYSFTATTDQFYKFEQLDNYGNGGGLEYFDVKDCTEGGHCSSAVFFKDGFDLTINGTVEFLRGPTSRTSQGSVIYTLHLSGEVTGTRFWVGLTTKCSVKPLSDHFLARNINKNLLNSSWVHVGSISGFSFDKTSTDLYLFNYSVVVIDENDKVVGCTTGRLSSGASAAPPTQVILVTGGDSDYAGNPAMEVEIYNPFTGISCDIGFNLTLKNHAQIGKKVCGGFETNSTNGRNCSELNKDGEFEDLNLELSGGFWTPGLPWNSKDGFAICNDETCDLVKSDDTVEENWISLYPKQAKSCIVTDSEDNSMILIGGEVDGVATEKVGRYDKTGKVAHLPDLIYPRISHGCAGYKNSMGKLVVLATGGFWPGDNQPTDKTELLLDPHTATAWQMAKPLPRVYDVLSNALITVDNVVYLIGGNATTDVLEWNSEMKEWREPGSMLNTPRLNHAVGAVPYSLLDHCE